MLDIYPPYIFGLHDRGGESLMLEKNRRGWVLVTEALGADPGNYDGSDYTDLTNQGLGVIVRLNHGYGTAGTIPYSSQYDTFAQRCGHFVQASPGCRIWIIGNEMNLANERPGGPGGQVITPQLYATCFKKCRDEIRRRPGHVEDQVVLGAVGPWNTETRYSGNLRGDWVRYFSDILNLLGDEVDGITLHTYTHGQEPNLVFDDTTMNPPFGQYHWHFRAYRDFLAVIPAGLRNRPVYITETDQYGAWRNENTGWVRSAYKEVDDWNQDPAHQPIQALILFRWLIGNPDDPQQVGWAIEDKPGVQDDFRGAMDNEYRVVLPDVLPDYRAAWLEVNAPGRMEPGAVVRFGVTVRNDGRSLWVNTGSQAVRLGYRWISAGGISTEGPRTNLPRSVAAGETVTLPAVTVRAPVKPGYYRLELDLVAGASDWFAEHGSPIWYKDGLQVGPRYRAAWLSVAAPSQGTVGTTVTFPVRVRNDGAFTWPPDGSRPVHLTYKWLDAARNVVVADGLRTPIGRSVGPLEEVTLNAKVQFPADGGQFILQMDMVHEFVVWFQWKGSPVYEAQVQVAPVVPEYAAHWLELVSPERSAVDGLGGAYLEVQNTGTRVWPRSGDQAVQLGYYWLDARGDQVLIDGAELRPMPSDIEPGHVAVFRDLQFVTPLSPGSYRLVWDLNQAGVWLSERGVAVQEQALQVVVSEYGVGWEMLEPLSERMPPGEEQHAHLRLHNTGTRTWSAGGDSPVHLAHHWFTQDDTLSEPWETFRVRLPQDVSPGATVDLVDIPFSTPPMLCKYVLRWDLVEEGRAWFFRQGGVPLEVAVEIVEKAFFVRWTAQASHNLDQVSFAFDGNPDTFWDSGAVQEPGMWFQVDLGQNLVLDRVRVSSPGRGFPVGYRITLSADGQDWHLVAEQPQNWASVDVAFAPCEARYVRLEQTGRPDWPATWMISEIVVSTTQWWAGADASHFSDDAKRAIDARLGTAWGTRNAKQRPGMWFKLDMGKVHQIERVSLEHPTNQQPRGYVMQVSTDGQSWQEVGRQDDNWGNADAQFASISARYVRVETSNSSHYEPWGITEIAVWRSGPVWVHGWEA